MDLAGLEKVSTTEWRIKPTGAMRVPAILYAGEALIRDMDEKVRERMPEASAEHGMVRTYLEEPALSGLKRRDFEGSHGGDLAQVLAFLVAEMHLSADWNFAHLHGAPCDRADSRPLSDPTLRHDPTDEPVGVDIGRISLHM
jgi:hypothetical protein